MFNKMWTTGRQEFLSVLFIAFYRCLKRCLEHGGRWITTWGINEFLSPPLGSLSHTHKNKHVCAYIFSSNILPLGPASHFSNLAPSKGPKLFPASSCQDWRCCGPTSPQARSYHPKATKGQGTLMFAIPVPRDPLRTTLTRIGEQAEPRPSRPGAGKDSLPLAKAARKDPMRCPR